MLRQKATLLAKVLSASSELPELPAQNMNGRVFSNKTFLGHFDLTKILPYPAAEPWSG